MAFVSLIFIFFAIIIVIAACVSPLIGIALFIISAVMKKKQLTKKKEAELAGNYSYQIKKTYIIPRIFGFIFMIPLVICIILVVYISIKPPADKQTSQNYIEENSDTSELPRKIYNSKFVLYVLDLTMIEDSSLRKEYGELYDWAVLFKATDWRDLKMLAAKNPYIEDTIFTLHEMTEDEKIREQCEAREKYNWDMAAATAKGKKEGQDLKLISQICRKLQKGKNIDTIAEELEENREIIAKICETAKAFAPEYNVQKIYDTLDTINE